VTQAVQPDFQVRYSKTNELAWSGGGRCRALSEICDNAGELEKAGVFGWCGFGFFSLGQCLLMVYVMRYKKGDMLRVLAVSLASFSLAWILLLCCWAIFIGAVHADATCKIMDASDTGIVFADGKFGDIIRGQGSYSLAFVIASWVFATVIVGVISHRVCSEYAKRRKGEPAPIQTSL
jgi:hypothetical protein